MKRILTKVKSNKGETLVEVLAAILIIALASALLMYSAVSASKVNDAANKDNEKYRNAVNEAEAKSAKSGNGKILIKEVGGSGEVKEVEVEFFGGEGKFTTYNQLEEDGVSADD